MAQLYGVNLFLVVAATMGGGVFGDHCSPISDTTIISSMSSASDHIDHVNTQMPYALLAGAGTALLYLALGFLMR
jgi:tetracycline resistance efflux pump